MDDNNSKEEFLKKMDSNDDNSGSFITNPWFFILILLIGMFIWFYFNHFIKSKNLSDAIGKAIAIKTNATKIGVSKFNWGKSVTCSSINAEFNEDNIFKNFIISNLSFKITKLNLLKNKWNFDTIRCGNVKINLTEGNKPIAKNNNDQSKPIKCKGIIPVKIIPNKLTVNHIEIAKLNLNWGNNKHNSGNIRNAYTNIKKTDDSYNITIKKGVFNHAWLKNINIITANLVAKDGYVKIEDSSLKFGKEREKGKAKITGKIYMENQKFIYDLNLVFDNVPVENIIGEIPNTAGALSEFFDLNSILYGDINGDLKIKGDYFKEKEKSKDDELHVSGKINASANFILRNLEFFDNLSYDFSRGNFIRISLLGSSINFKIQDGIFEANNLTLNSEEVLNGKGAINFNPYKRLFSGYTDLTFFKENMNNDNEDLAKILFGKDEKTGHYTYKLNFNSAAYKLTKEDAEKIATKIRLYKENKTMF